MDTQVKQANKPNRSKVNLVVDIVIFLAFLIATAPHFTGIAIHEWLGLAFSAAIITHLLLHWQWIVETTKRIFSKLSGKTRLNYALNILLFIDVTLIAFTGIMISKSALPTLGITLAGGMAWRSLHFLTSAAAVVLVGLHVAMHWQWIADAVRRYVVSSIAARILPAAPAPVKSAMAALRKEI